MEDTHLQLLRLLESKPTLSQRALARELGISLGKINYCLNALIAKGLSNYGMTSRAAVRAFLDAFPAKLDEYESLKREIALLQREVAERPRRDR